MRPRRTHPDATIAAVATPPGRGGVGIVRISGPSAGAIARAILRAVPPPRRAAYREFLDASGDPIDSGIALFFPAPRSFTGEDILELQAHGGPVVLDRLLQRALALGARIAQPGEFSQRAFLNGKLDLVQAEAIADLIDSGSAQAARSALRSLQGYFSASITRLGEQLADLRAYVEAAIDFPDEDVEHLSQPRLHESLQRVVAALDETLARAFRGHLLREGMTVVIAGRPNVGKSSLLNALAGRDSAIVTDIPGTTRDLLREYIQLDGLPLHVIDTAGLRSTEDRVERIGVDRAWTAILGADAVLVVVDDQTGYGPEEEEIFARLTPTVPRVLVHNKIDCSGRPPALHPTPSPTRIYLSALTGAGLKLLTDHLKALVGYSPGETEFLARRRHLDALEQARLCLNRATENLGEIPRGELLAEDLRQAQHALASITGEITTEDLLAQIFSTFCIGK